MLKGGIVDMTEIKISPSLLSADWLNIGPPSSSYILTCLVVCLPRALFTDNSPVSLIASPTIALINEDLPTADCPAYMSLTADCR